VPRAPLAPVFFFVGCPTVPFSLGAFGWAARFVGTLLFAGLPISFGMCNVQLLFKFMLMR
jgi:hypothetical protein